MSKLIETRAEFQHLSGERLQEAEALLSLAKWGGAYYLAGYAVELALKACVIKRLMATDGFPPKDFSRDCYTHDLAKLIDLSGLTTNFTVARTADAELRKNWLVTRKWSEEMRYHLVAEVEARALFNAIADAAHGVLTWVRTHW